MELEAIERLSQGATAIVFSQEGPEIIQSSSVCRRREMLASLERLGFAGFGSSKNATMLLCADHRVTG